MPPTVRIILALLDAGATAREVAAAFDLSPVAVSKIDRGLAHRDVTGDRAEATRLECLDLREARRTLYVRLLPAGELPPGLGDLEVDVALAALDLGGTYHEVAQRLGASPSAIVWLAQGRTHRAQTAAWAADRATDREHQDVALAALWARLRPPSEPERPSSCPRCQGRLVRARDVDGTGTAAITLGCVACGWLWDPDLEARRDRLAQERREGRRDSPSHRAVG